MFGGDLYSNDGVITVALAVGHLGSTVVACVLVVLWQYMCVITMQLYVCILYLLEIIGALVF